jgi:hypothetical protein
MTQPHTLTLVTTKQLRDELSERERRGTDNDEADYFRKLDGLRNFRPGTLDAFHVALNDAGIPAAFRNGANLGEFDILVFDFAQVPLVEEIARETVPVNILCNVLSVEGFRDRIALREFERDEARRKLRHSRFAHLVTAVACFVVAIWLL